MANVKQDIKVKKKKWYTIMAPKMFGGTIGETITSDPNMMIGKTVTSNLMNLTGEMRQQSTNLKFRITGVEDDSVNTEPISYELVPPSIKRFVRRDTERIDESFVCETADGVLLKIKPLLVTAAKAKGSQIKVLRKFAVGLTAKEIKTLSYEEFLKMLIGHRFQSDLKKNLNKIFPLKTCEIRKVEVVKKEKAKKVVSPDFKWKLKKSEKEESDEKADAKKSPEANEESVISPVIS